VELPANSERGPGAALLLITIIVTGVFLLSYASVQNATDQQRKELAERASIIATALDANTIHKLEGTPSDADKPEYAQLKSKLLALKQISTDIRVAYLMGERDGRIFVYADSERPTSHLYSPAGEAYPEATDALKNMFYSSPVPLVEGPVEDKYGKWYSGLAPIFHPKTGKVMAVVGIDIDDISFNQVLLSALTLPLGGGLMLTIVVLAYEWTRRHDQQLLRLRSELVSIASHELRSPLVGIRWALETALKKTPDEQTAKTLRAIYDSVIHLQAGTDDILQFTSIIQHGTRVKKMPTDMHLLLSEICDAQRLVAAQKGVNLVIDATLPEGTMIDCDPDRMRRAFHNVISNAIKYTRSNTDVIVRYERSPKEHHISVIDHGIGIPKQEQQRVFAGFYRASNAKATGVGGTGLGLYLTRVILSQHNGHITFFSREGKGTAFVLTLPAKEKIEPH
jgi:signal transduction histidine kinase